MFIKNSSNSTSVIFSKNGVNLILKVSVLFGGTNRYLGPENERFPEMLASKDHSDVVSLV